MGTDNSLQEYYLLRLTEYIPELQGIYDFMVALAEAHKNSVKIITSLTKAHDFKEISDLAKASLPFDTVSSVVPLTQMIEAIQGHDILASKEGTQLILSHLKKGLASLGQTEPQEKKREQLLNLAHTLSGSGGTFGFPDISTVGNQLEHSLPENQLPLLKQLIQILKHHTGTGNGLASHNAKILVIQKNKDLAFMIEHQLKSQQLQPHCVENASQAWQALGSSEFSLIVTDLVLPDIDGRRLIHELRSRVDTRHLPIILLVSETSQRALKGQDLDVDKLLCKPFEPEFLLKIVLGLLGTAEPFKEHHEPSDFSALPTFDDLESHIQSLDLTQGDGLLLMVQMKTQNKGPLSSSSFKLFVQALKNHLHPTFYPAYLKKGSLALLLPQRSQAQAISFLNQFWMDLNDTPHYSEMTSHHSYSAALAPFSGEPLGEQLEQLAHLIETPLLEIEPGIYAQAEVPQDQAKYLLLADDDPLIASIIRFRLEQLGYRVGHISEGDKVIEQLSIDPPDALILDVKMPGLDGFSVLEQLRDSESTEDLPVMMLTSLGNETHVVRGFDLGANDYLTKPFSPDEFIRRVHRLLKA